MLGNAVGSSTVNIQPPAGIAAPPVPMLVNVTPPALSMDNVEVGHNLAATMTLKAPFNGQHLPVITSSNPSLVLVSTSYQSAGAAAVTALP